MRIKYVILGLAFCGGFFACAIDFDHILLWVFGIQIHWILPNILWSVAIEGRNLHSLYFWIPANIIIARILTPFVVRLFQPDSYYEVSYEWLNKAIEKLTTKQ